MADVTGPISSLPGSAHALPDGTMCDDHPDRPAIARIQGETDSMGCEMYDLCRECMDAHREAVRVERENPTPSRCDWCKTETTDCRPTRDYEEGMCGPVYDVCAACRKRVNDAAEADLDEHYDKYGDPEDDYDLSEDCGRWLNGRLDQSCRLAGTEFCDWDCPLRGRV